MKDVDAAAAALSAKVAEQIASLGQMAAAVAAAAHRTVAGDAAHVHGRFSR